MIVGNVIVFVIKNEECKFWDNEQKNFEFDLSLATLFRFYKVAERVRKENKLKSSKVVELRIDEVEDE